MSGLSEASDLEPSQPGDIKVAMTRLKGHTHITIGPYMLRRQTPALLGDLPGADDGGASPLERGCGWLHCETYFILAWSPVTSVDQGLTYITQIGKREDPKEDRSLPLVADNSADILECQHIADVSPTTRDGRWLLHDWRIGSDHAAWGYITARIVAHQRAPSRPR